MSAHRGSTDLDFIVPGDPAQRTGGYLYDARIVEALRHLGWTVTVHGLPGRFAIRLEEIAVVTDTGCEILSTLSRAPFVA